MFEKEDKYFIVVSLVLALILLSLSFNLNGDINKKNIDLQPPQDNCPMGKVFSCPAGYVSIDSSNTGRSEYSSQNCGTQEYMLVGTQPYRIDSRKVCKSSNIFSLNFRSYKISSTCQNYPVPYDGSSDDYNQIATGSCSPTVIYD